MTLFFNPNARKVNTTEYYDPYVKVEIEATDHNNVVISPVINWKSNRGADTSYWKEYGLKWVALKKASTYADHKLSKTLTIPETGEYRVLALVMKAPFSKPSVAYISLAVDNNTLGHESLEAPDRFACTIDFGTTTLTAGSHVFSITSPKYSYVAAVFVRKIRRFYGNNSGKGNLIPEKFNFSLNSVNSLNQFSLDLLMKNAEYPLGYKDSRYKGGYVFEFRDAINFYVGDTRRNARRMFGGYVTVPSISSDGSKLTLKGVDRLMDFTQRNIYKQINIGGVAQQGTTDTPTYNSNSFYDGIKYLCSSVEYPLDYSTVDEVVNHLQPPENGKSIAWSSKTNYANVKVKGMKKSLKSIKLLGKMLRLQNGGKSTEQSATLFDNRKKPVDVAVYPIIEFPYYIKEEVIKTETTTSSTGSGGADSMRRGVHRRSTCSNESYEKFFLTSTDGHCPACGSNRVVMDVWKSFCWNGVCFDNPCEADGGYTCLDCDADYCGVSGYSADTACSKRIKITSKKLDKAPVRIDPTSPVKCGDSKASVKAALAKGGGKTTKTTKTTETKTTPNQNPFLFDLEITYYKAGESSSTDRVKSIEFTGHKGDYIMGTITPQLELGKAKIFSVNVKELLDVADPSTHYYVKKIRLVHTATKDELKESKNRYMYFGTLKIHTGEAINPKLYQSAGKMPMDILKTIITDNGYCLGVLYGKERRYDSLELYLEGESYSEYEIIEGVNLIDITNSKKTAKQDLNNSFSMAYKKDDTSLALTQKMDLESIGHFCILDDYAKLDTTSKYYADFQAKQKLKAAEDKGYSYTAVVTGASNVRAGQLVPCTIYKDPYLSGVKVVKTIECDYQRDSSPELKFNIGLEKPDSKFTSVINELMKDLRDRRKGDLKNVYKEIDPAYVDFIMDGWTVDGQSEV